MATGAASFSLSGATHIKACEAWSGKSSSFVKTPMVAIQRKSNSQRTNAAKLSIRADYSDRRGGGGSGGDFVAGLLLGGAIFGTLGYIFAPQIRRSLLNEDEYGFRRAKRPIYHYDEGLEKTRQTLNKKLDQLNSAIDKVSSRLRGGNKMPSVPVETDPEEATMRGKELLANHMEDDKKTTYKDYYKVLEVEYDASDETIRLNYRKLALKWHPDKHKCNDAVTAKFQEINEAYTVLSDPDKRLEYDLNGNYEINDYTLPEYLSRFKGMILTSNGLGMSSVWSEQFTEFNKLMDK